MIYQNIFDLFIFAILYILPMVLIFYTYTGVVKVLWKWDKNIAWNENEANKLMETAGGAMSDTRLTCEKNCLESIPNSTCSFRDMNNCSGTSGQGQRQEAQIMSASKFEISPASYTMASGSSAAKSKMKDRLMARRKAAKMLICVALMFAICYLPIHLLNILR
jgi:hypothetical protein